MVRERTVECRACPLLRRDGFRNFTPSELRFVSRFKKGELHVLAGRMIVHEGATPKHLFTVLKGWGYRHKALPDGRRQIVNFLLPGHFVGLQGVMNGTMPHSVEALSDMILCVFDKDELFSLYSAHPELALDVTWLSSREEMVLDENLLSLGRRSALERVAALLLHLYFRAERVGLAADGKVEFPFTQQHLADALGLSLVHTNKTLRRLINGGLVRWVNGTCELLDRKALAGIAHFDLDEKIVRPFI